MEGISLAGGNMQPVVRVGDTVRRVAGEWTPAVHALLAAPAPRLWDLAYLAYRIVPFVEDARETGDLDRDARLNALIAAYGMPFTRADVLWTAADRLDALQAFTLDRARETARDDFCRTPRCTDAMRHPSALLPRRTPSSAAHPDGHALRHHRRRGSASRERVDIMCIIGDCRTSKSARRTRSLSRRE